MGLLSDKTRILDTILTDEGRRQLGSGNFKPMFYSFSDASAVYSPLDSLATGSVPSSSIRTLVAFEAFPLPQDQVAYEADDGGGIRVFPNNNYFPVPDSDNHIRVINGQLVNNQVGTVPEVITGSAQFASLATSIITASGDNFRTLMMIKSPDLFYQDRSRFIVSKNNINFQITNDTVLPGNVNTGILESTDNLFNDKRLSHLDNFKYLAPINKRSSNNLPATPIGNYDGAINGNEQINTLEDLRNEFTSYVVRSGSVNTSYTWQRDTISFGETSITNRIVGQIFEIANGKVTKLDVVDFGAFIVPANAPPLFADAVPVPLNPDSLTATTRIHVYFAGKVFIDDVGNQKFINMFSLIFQ